MTEGELEPRVSESQPWRRLAAIFDRLPQENKDALRWHDRHGTQIFCGDDWGRFRSQGAGTPEVLMQSIRKPTGTRYTPDDVTALEKVLKISSNYLDILRKCNEEDVRRAIREVCVASNTN